MKRYIIFNVYEGENSSGSAIWSIIGSCDSLDEDMPKHDRWYCHEAIDTQTGKTYWRDEYGKNSKWIESDDIPDGLPVPDELPETQNDNQQGTERGGIILPPEFWGKIAERIKESTEPVHFENFGVIPKGIDIKIAEKESDGDYTATDHTIHGMR